MALLAYNKTGAPVTLAHGIGVHPVLPASGTVGVRGPAFNVTAYLRPSLAVDPAHGVVGGLAASDYADLQAQSASVDFVWSAEPEYVTTGLDVVLTSTRHALTVAISSGGGGANVFHQDADVTLAALTPLAGGALLAVAGARYLAMRTSLLTHFASTGSLTVNGYHKAADGVNGAGMGTTVTLLADLITRIGEMKTAVIAHATQAGVHFANDTTLAALALTVDPPVSQANCNSDLNDILAALKTHYAAAGASII